MHVIAPSDIAPYRIAGTSEAAIKLRATASEMRAKFDITVTTHLTRGTNHAEIAARAHATGACLVVLGAREERFVRDIFVGSTAQRLQWILRTPLLIARSRSARAYARVLVAIDFTKASVMAAHAAASLFPSATLHFLHVCTPMFESRLSMAGVGADEIRAYRNEAALRASYDLDEFIRANGLQSRRRASLVRHGHVAGCISDSAKEMGAWVVALGAKGKSRFQAGVLGSVSEKFMRGAGPDVLLAKAFVQPGRNHPSDGSRHPDRQTESAERTLWTSDAEPGRRRGQVVPCATEQRQWSR